MTIPVGKGHHAIIDEQDFPLLKQYTWYLYKNKKSPIFYAHTKTNGKYILMHRMILQAPSNLAVDHKNHNGLDNRRENIRLCTLSQNQANSRCKKNKYGFRGIVFSRGSFSAFIGKDRKTYLGNFKTAKEAALAYNKAAIEMFGEFATLNEI